MPRLRLHLLVIALVLVPGVAHAGWIDWLNRLSGPGPFIGFGEQFDVYCFDKDGNRYPWCNGVVYFKKRADTLTVEQLKHIISAQTEFFWSVPGAQRFEDVSGDDRQVRAIRLGGLYKYRFTDELDAGGGIGFLRVSGAGFDPLYRPTLTPVMLSFGPFQHSDHKNLVPIRLTFEQTYIGKGFNGRQFGNTVTTYDTHGGEWKSTFGATYDLRRWQR